MLELPHSLIGVTIATQVSNPLLAFPLALASHFVTDYFVPHWNPHIYRETQKYGKPTRKSTLFITGDAMAALLVGGVIAGQALPDVKKFLVILVCGFLAVLPDVVEAPFFYLGIKPEWMVKFINWQRRHQWDVPPLLGLSTQVVAMIICLWVIL